ncbi:acetylxylan esterase [Algoriphagus sp. CAU 1675]|uniref:alpha/beta hydrolase family protein n=1 Tax=Algoriphagus sp. CAU 1675 TaxID=3032597 RepID=UPI0023DB3601|nr:acetylxylan esterase [Algoriphagus sp. CAU 1675]MDF2157272.1 acetylxylan esterase [Algoriphagus sp. CAU 1675]
MKTLFSALFTLLFSQFAMSQPTPNYDESKVPDLVLPDPFVSAKGKIIQSAKEWEEIRRPEIFRLFEEQVYGKIPTDLDNISFEEVKESENPYPDQAILKEVNITVSRKGQHYTMRLNVFIPKSGKGPFPVILLINYSPKYPNGQIVEEGFWPVPELIAQGFATASFHAETVAPDDKIRFSEGIISKLYPEQLEQADGMRALGAWGWGAMRAMDYFENSALFDSEKSVLVGHSRAGKATLWASANDPRWAVTIPNESGCGGAALSKRKFGETVQVINTSFPHWFNDNFKSYNNKEEELPIDQHLLVSLIAPRAIYFSSAREDRWADPKGEYLSLTLGSRVYQEIFGKKAVFPLEFEELQGPILQPSMGYHIREGEHNLTPEDWKHYLEFIKLNFKN